MANIKDLKVIVKTKSNFRDLNGKILDVFEIVGTRVTCKVWDDIIQKKIQIDFSLKEVVEFK